MSGNRLHTLYLCYFGLREPLVQTQVLPYLREIKKIDELKVSLLTFEPDYKEKWSAEQMEAEKKKLVEENISWHCLPYHKRPSVPATLYDVLNGVRFVVRLSRKEKIDILHARAHIPMLMALIATKFIGSQIIFDIRGLMAEEYADAGTWQENSKRFRFIKRIERKGIEKAAQIVVLTNQMRDYLIENKLKKIENIEVIPCCVDFMRLDRKGETIEKNKRFELIYAGSVIGLYLLREMGSFFLELKKHKPNGFFRILTTSPLPIIQEAFNKLGISKNDYAVIKVSPDDVPKYLKQAHLGISFRKPTFAQIAASPTKIPEYLACGLPIIANDGIGDTTEITIEDKIGVIIEEFSPEKYRKALIELEKLLENKKKLAERCRESAKVRFDLQSVGGARYKNLYRRLLEKD